MDPDGRADAPSGVATFRGHVLGAVVVATVACVIAWRSPDWAADDAYIVARYASNLARHGTYAWNLDGPPVEGITGQALAFLETVAVVLRVDPVAFARALGVGSLVAGAWATSALAWALRPSLTFAIVAGVAFSLVGEHAPHVRSGLETEFWIATNLVAAWAFLRATRPVEPKSGAFFVTLVALVVTRPEGMAVALFLSAAWFVANGARAATGVRWSLLRRWAFAFVVPVAILTLARAAHFHALLPNTFHAKRGTPNSEFVDDVLAMLLAGPRDFLLLGAWAAFVTRDARRPIGEESRSVPRVGLLLLVALGVVFATTVAYGSRDLVMNYGRRFAMHVLPWIVVAILVAMVPVVDVIRSQGTRWRGPFVLATILSLLAFVHDSAGAREAASSSAIDRGKNAGPRNVEAAAWLRANVRPDATLACYPDAGLLPYASGLRAIDFGKLNDATLARPGVTPEAVSGYFYERNPDVLSLWRRANGRPYDDGATRIVEDPRFREYLPGWSWAQVDGSGLFLYVKRGAWAKGPESSRVP
ncbi:MAG: hypothetical protein U0169_07695 [Polyangiaceae bacterium]